tara:strand:- start:393 stop:545 length:153 start_codon:yes stop_codon:yes gene_type:complete
MIYSKTFGIEQDELKKLYEENEYLKRQIKEYKEVIKKYKSYIEYIVKKTN